MHPFIRGPRFTVRSSSRRHNNRIRMHVSDASIDYITAFVTYLCDDPKSCLDSMILPDPSEQARIVQSLFDIRNRCDTHGLDGAFIKLLMNHDDAAVDLLVSHLQKYDASAASINDIVRYTRPIHLPNGGDNA